MPARITRLPAIRDMLFSQSIDDLSQPFEVPGGWAVVKFTKIHEATQPTMVEAAEMVGARMRNLRMEQSLQALLAEWREEFGVTIYEKPLAEMPSWEEAVRASSDAQTARAAG